MECRRVYKEIYYANEADAHVHTKYASNLKDTYIVCVHPHSAAGNYSYRTTTRRYTRAKVVINYITGVITADPTSSIIKEFIVNDFMHSKYFRDRDIIAVLYVHCSETGESKIVSEVTRHRPVESKMVDTIMSQLSKVSL